jgi:integrase
MGRGQLVFRAALSGGKNAASRRNLPVHPGDAELFRTVLADLDLPEGASRYERDRRIRQRVTNLSRAFGRFTDPDTKTSLYSQRHTFADLLRDVGALNEEVSAILGHAEEGSKATAVYGGMQSLERRAELLGKVRALIP